MRVSVDMCVCVCVWWLFAWQGYHLMALLMITIVILYTTYVCMNDEVLHVHGFAVTLSVYKATNMLYVLLVACMYTKHVRSCFIYIYILFMCVIYVLYCTYLPFLCITRVHCCSMKICKLHKCMTSFVHGLNDIIDDTMSALVRLTITTMKFAIKLGQNVQQHRILKWKRGNKKIRRQYQNRF